MKDRKSIGTGYIIAAIIIGLISVPIAGVSQQHNGQIGNAQTWDDTNDDANGWHWIVGNLTIIDGGSVTIENIDGLGFDDDWTFTVEAGGELIINGVSDNVIDIAGDDLEWRFEFDAGSTVEIAFCDISRQNEGVFGYVITSSTAALSITDCNVHNSGGGIRVLAGHIALANTHIFDNLTENGLRIESDADELSTISDCYFHNNLGGAAPYPNVDLYANSRFEMYYTEFEGTNNAGSHGILFNFDDAENEPVCLIYDCNFHDYRAESSCAINYVYGPSHGELDWNILERCDFYDNNVAVSPFRESNLKMWNCAIRSTNPDNYRGAVAYHEWGEGDLFTSNCVYTGQATVIESWTQAADRDIINSIFADNTAGFSGMFRMINRLDYIDYHESGNLPFNVVHLTTDDPEWVDPDFATLDMHLSPNSPCVDFGDPDPAFNDLNFTRNDLGIYGGPHADPAMAGILFGTVVAGQHEVVVEGVVPAGYEYIIPANVTMEFAEAITIEADATLNIGDADVIFTDDLVINGSLIIGNGASISFSGWTNVGMDGLLDIGDADLTFEGNLTVSGETEIAAGAIMEFAAGRGISVNGDMDVSGAVNNYAVFRGIQGAGWNGITYWGDGVHNSIVDFADISGAASSGIDWSGTRIANLSNSRIHDNLWGIHTSLNNDGASIQNCEIYSNDEYGIFGAEVAGDVWILLSSIHNNGFDGVRIGGSTTIDGCDVYSNGHDGLCLFYGDAQIINCDIYQNAWSGIRLNGWQGGNGTIWVGAQDGTNLIHHNGQYGMYVTDIHFINECNIIEHNPLYGIWVMGNFPAYFNTDHIRLNGPSSIGTGIGFNNGFAVMNHTSSDSNYFRGMEAWNLSWVDMAPPQNDPMWLTEDSSRFMNNGWQPTPPPLIPMANVDEIYLGSQANIWIANGRCDIYDTRFAGDRIVSRFPNMLGLIDGVTCYFGMPNLGTFNPPGLIFNVGQLGANYLNSVEEDETAQALLGEATGAMRQGEYEDAYDILRRILTDYIATPSAASCPGLLQVCIRELELDLDDNREFLEQLEVEEDNVALLRSREQVVNMLLLFAGDYDNAIANFTEVMEAAESLQDSVEAAMNLAYAERVREMEEDENGLDGVGASFDTKITELLKLMHSDATFTGTHPVEFDLTSVYPNPFNNATTISYSLPEESWVKISIHDLGGREVGVVYEGVRKAGNYSAVWQADDIASGIYVCKIKAGEKVQSVKMTLLK